MLIDNSDLFIGSPNLTGKGMSLTPVPNKEMGVKLKAHHNEIQIINNLVQESILINDQIYKNLLDWKNSLPNFEIPSYPEFPTEIKPNSWVVWPHSSSKGWCDQITGVLPG